MDEAWLFSGEPGEPTISSWLPHGFFPSPGHRLGLELRTALPAEAVRRAPGRLQAVYLRRLELRLFASVNGEGFDGFRLEINGFIMGLMVI